MERIITKKFLKENSDCIFVFGDNSLRIGYGGAAALRDEPNAYGFITKKAPNNLDASFYKPEEYEEIFYQELMKLCDLIENNTKKKFLISKLGSGLANRFGIWEQIILPKLELLRGEPNVELLWENEVNDE